MNECQTLVKMLGQLLKEMEIVTSQGAGYYTCAPFAQRFNKLLGAARGLAETPQSIISTFDEIDPSDPSDPADKSKVLLGIRIEISQLIALLESMEETSA